jgi:hypothetical protein
MSAQQISQLVTQLVKATQSRRRRPSERNLEIHEEVRVNGLTQFDMAVKHGLTQRRVSAICKQVDRWYGEHEPWELGEPQGAAGQRAERVVAKRRLENVYGWALRGLSQSGVTLTHYNIRQTDGEPTVRQTQRKEQQLNVQWAKVAKGTAEKLLDLAEEAEAAEIAPPPRVARGESVLRAVACLRRVIRHEVKQGGTEGVACLVEQVVRACLGEAPAPEAPQAIVSQSPVQPAEHIERAVEAKCSNYSAVDGEKASVAREVTATVVGASGVAAATCESAAERKSVGDRRENGSEKNERRIGSQSSPTVSVGQAPPRNVASTPRPTGTVGPLTLAQQEQRALGEIERLFAIVLTREQADQATTEILEQGTGHAAMQGFDQRQRAALLEWRRLMGLRDRGVGVPPARVNRDTPTQAWDAAHTSPGSGLVPPGASG